MKNSIKILVLIMLSTVFSLAEPAKVVYDLTSGDIKVIKKSLIRSLTAVAKYYESTKQDIDIMVVVSGDAYKFFINDF